MYIIYVNWQPGSHPAFYCYFLKGTSPLSKPLIQCTSTTALGFEEAIKKKKKRRI